ncbi:M3 family oligoendopeptidase [Clostridium felsineum]|uniref:Uncharacterized protein n=1 Tax=Clostridium felsineum TaxID=36839 RepID=A0A1S8LR27_9CLOT|nr:M3 family oligoendopeptidase [Clostridium felsineum]MCR3760178.1 M3 family oligoendopeptidase [Clostridium felsineum]URZ05580.1 hypothetical protein CLROS_009060 [Clostridium felsineum]URZ10619.1 hypothetical protein CROST_013290 [Clostridium felsineum]
MDLTWNLDNIYTSFESEKFKEDSREFEKITARINNFNFNMLEKDITKLKIEDFLKCISEYQRLYYKIYSYAYLIISANTENIKAMQVLDDIENKKLESNKSFVKFSKCLYKFNDLDEIINGSMYLLEHKVYLKELVLKAKYLLDGREEFIINKMQSTGARNLERLYMETVGSEVEEISVDGKNDKFTLPELHEMLYSKDAVTRKKAYYKEIDLCRNLARVSASCINGISGEAINVCSLRDFNSPLEKVLMKSRMNVKTLEVMMEAIKESLPIFQKYFAKKAKVLGYKSNLPFYDIYAPISDSDIKVSYDEAESLIISSFKNFSSKLSDFAGKVFKNRWIDAEPRKGKVNFGLSICVFPIKESRIIVNFNESYNDVSILAHEIGHAYHDSKLYSKSILNTEYPVPMAETASIFCETILSNELVNKLPKKEAVDILEKDISNTAYFIVDFYGRYLFEKELYERRRSGILTIEELNEMMFKCMKKSYGKAIDQKTIHPYMWLNKAGYFMPENEFLNFPYSFGVLFSKGLYAKYVSNKKSFAEKYDKFLEQTSSMNMVDAAKLLEVDINSIEFFRASIKLIEKDIEKFIELA